MEVVHKEEELDLDQAYRFVITDGEFKGKRCQLLTQSIASPTPDGGVDVYRAVLIKGEDKPRLVLQPHVSDAWTLREFAANFNGGEDPMAKFKWLQNNMGPLELTLFVYKDTTFASNVDPVSGEVTRGDKEYRFNLDHMGTPKGISDVLTALGYKFELKLNQDAPEPV